MILIVSFEGNAHVDCVREKLNRPSVQLDLGTFPARSSLVARLDDEQDLLALRAHDGSMLDLQTIGAVWCRRISPLGLDSSLTEQTAQLFAWSEANEALRGVAYGLGCYWMNTPLADEVAQRKIHQLRLARRLGLSIPETLVTNDPETAREVIDAWGSGQVVRKAFRNLPDAPRTTSIVGEAELALIESVRFTPVIFQRFVPAELDLRVTIVDEEIFAASIRSQPGYEVDYRPGVGTAEMAPYELPEVVAERLLRLMGELDLNFGAIDMRVTPDGEHVFLEVNPAGEFLFVSERTDLPIPAAIAAALDRHDEATIG